MTRQLGEDRVPSGFFHGSLWEPARFFWTLAAVGGVIGLASFYKIHQISRRGGALIAAELGGRFVPRATGDARERRLVNVIDEMSIASGIPAPQTFILDGESGLNAFAAGMTTQNSVVAVTRGLLDQLDRDQLQGVIGHEISHIVNGDARLNLRIIGVLYGIFFLAQGGRVLLQARGKNAGPAISLGIVLMLIGSVGLFFGKVIQAAVSREREYLADASAVQLTRNPNGLAGALRHLMRSGSRIRHPKGEAASHLFFGAGHGGFSLSSLFATHPPIEKRIARIDRHFRPGTLPKSPAAGAKLPGAMSSPEAELAGISFLNGIGALAPAQLVAAQTLLAALPESLTKAAHRPEDAQAVVHALLLSREADVQTQQLAYLREAHTPELAEAALKHAQWLFRQGARHRLPLLDLALPALCELSSGERSRFLKSAEALIRADGHVSISEFAIHRILKSVLEPAQRTRPPFRQERLQQAIIDILAMLAHAGNADREAAAAAFRHAAALVPALGDGPWEFPDRKTVRPKAVDAALEDLARAAPRFREKLLAACVAVAEHDGKITLAEAELLRAFAQSLDCPAPPVFAEDGT
jgi:Zn-dependent protease with chaperone function